MEAKKVRGGVEIRFAPSEAGHADNKAPTVLSRLVFSPLLLNFQSLRGSSGNLRMKVSWGCGHS